MKYHIKIILNNEIIKDDVELESCFLKRDRELVDAYITKHELPKNIKIMLLGYRRIRKEFEK
jgi:hypothetical protein